jgi:hypothetical protein
MRPFTYRRNDVEYEFTPLPDMTEDDVIACVPERKVVAPPPPPTPTPGDGTVRATLTSLTATELNIAYSNATKENAILKIRVGSKDRPDRLVPAGKTVTSTYTTTVRTGFSGQKITVLHVEKNQIIFEQVL